MGCPNGLPPLLLPATVVLLELLQLQQLLTELLATWRLTGCYCYCLGDHKNPKGWWVSATGYE
jgi:hypothetical protein